ncbi:uncharacterized protein LOC142768695 isoform X4 [Rhipicephalus microplus]|uniref:uncharacterized protein LOC142768695 isoform X4 n=1 Tax=Rhipicephalus microplus TaxID=6941 RepID=UPI003F6D8F0A
MSTNAAHKGLRLHNTKMVRAFTVLLPSLKDPNESGVSVSAFLNDFFQYVIFTVVDSQALLEYHFIQLAFQIGGIPGSPKILHSSCLPNCIGMQAGQTCGINCTCCYHSLFNNFMACVADNSRLPHGLVRPAHRQG